MPCTICNAAPATFAGLRDLEPVTLCADCAHYNETGEPLRLIQAPILNSNGTPAARLLEQYRAALEAVQAARAAMVEAFPNGRDYCQAGNYGAARAEYEGELARLDTVADFLATLCAAVEQ